MRILAAMLFALMVGLPSAGKAVLAAPSPVTAWAEAGALVNIQWSYVTGAARYALQRDSAGTPVDMFGTPVLQPVTFIQDLAFDGVAWCGKNITYTVMAVDGSEVSGTAATVVLQVPCRPVGLTASVQVSALALSWSAALSSTAASYDIYRASYAPVSLIGAALASVTGTAYVDLLVPGDQLLNYAVVARDLSGNAGLALTNPAPWPLAPSALSASATGLSGQVLLSWQKSLTMDVSAYQVFRSTQADPATSVFTGYAAVNSLTVSGGVDGVPNHYWVAVDIGGAGPGPRSSLASASPYQPPSAPVLSFQPIPASPTVLVGVNPGATFGFALGAQRLEKKTTGGFAFERSLPAALTTVAVSVPCGQAVSFQARTIDTVGNSSAYSAILALALPCAPLVPSPLQALSVSAGNLTLSWSGVTIGAGASTAWRIAKASGPGFADPLPDTVAVLPAASSSHVQPLTQGASAWFKVYGLSAEGLTSVASVEVAAAPPPLGLSTTASRNRVYLSWTGVKTGLQPVDFYRVYHASYAFLPGEAGVSVTTTGAVGSGPEGLTISGLAPGLTYYFCLASNVSGFEGVSSTVVSASTSLGSPSIVSVQQSAGGPVSFTVAAADLEGDTPAAYFLQRAPDALLSSTIQVALSPVAGLLTAVAASAPSLDYYYVFVSGNSGVLSSVSPSSVAVPSVPAPVVSASLTQASRVLLRWAPVALAAEYQVYRATLGLTSTARYYSNDTMVTRGTSYLDALAVNGQENRYRVLARAFPPLAGSLVESAYSAPVSATPVVLPGAPGSYYLGDGSLRTYLTVTARPGLPEGPGLADLSWSRAETGSLLLSAYAVYRGFSATALSRVATLAVTQTSYVDTYDGPGAGLIYGVSALDSGGSEGARTSNTAAPYVHWGAPLAASGLAGGSSATIAWAAPTLKGSYPLSGYDVHRRYQVLSSALWLTRTSALNYLDSTVNTLASTSVQYLIQAVDALGRAGVLSATATVSFPAFSGSVPLPSTVAGIDVKAIDSVSPGALLSWEPNPLYESVSQYAVWRDSILAGTVSGTAFSDSPLVDGVSHVYLVQAVNASGAGLSGTAVPLPYPVGPPIPQGLSMAADVDANGDTTSGVRLAWADLGASASVTGYLVYRSTGAFAGLTNAVLVGSPSGPFFKDDSIVAATAYEYKVLAMRGGASSLEPGSALSLSAGMNGVPGSGLFLSATADLALGNRVSLQWSPLTGAQQYWVFRSTAALDAWPSSSLKVAALPGSTAYVDMSPTGAILYYAVAGANFLGRGPALTATAAASPAKVTGLVAVAGHDAGLPTAHLSWSAPVGPVAATAYLVFRSTYAGAFLDSWSLSPVADLTSTAYVDDASAFAGQRLSYWVSAYDVQSGPLSTRVEMVPRAIASTPTALAAYGVNGGVNLAWQPAPAAEGVTGYELSYAFAGALTQTSVMLPASPTAHLHSPLANGQSASYILRSFNSSGPSAFSLSVSAQANAAGPPSSVKGLRARVGFVEASSATARVVLSWTAAGSGNAVVLYRSTSPLGLSQAAGGADSPFWVTGSSGLAVALTDAAISAGQDYYYAMTVLGPDGFPGAESAPALLPVTQPFNYPGFVALSATAAQSRIDLVWSPPALSGTAGLSATPYRLYRYTASLSPVFKVTPPDAGYPLSFGLTQTSLSDLSVINGTSYSYLVSVVDGQGREAEQAAGALNRIPSGPRMPPGTIVALAGDLSVILQWLAPKSEADAGVRYNVYRREEGFDFAGPLPHLSGVGPVSSQFAGVTQLVQTLIDMPTTESPLLNTVTYYYSLAPLNPSGEGPKSKEIKVTPFKPLDPGKLSAANTIVTIAVVEKKKVALSWGGTPSQAGNGGYDVTAYRVYRSADGGTNYQRLFEMAGTSTTAGAYTDPLTQFGATYIYKVVPVDSAGNEGLSYRLQTVTLPQAINAVQLYRNAFNPALGDVLPVQFSLVQPGKAWVKVFTLQGDYVATLFDEEVVQASPEQPFLSEKKDWNGYNHAGQAVASGVYLVHLEAPGFRANARVAVIK